MTAYEVAVISALAIWLLATIVCQTSAEDGLEERIRRCDPFALIPRWTFFAPNPGTTDHHLLYRDTFGDGVTTPWKEVHLSVPRTILGALWNPKKRNTKALTDAVQSLIEFSTDMEPDGLKTTLPYILILNFITSLPRSPLSRATQFVVMESFGYVGSDTPVVVVQSDLHTLPPRNTAAVWAA